MERDFLGLNLKESITMAKEEIKDGLKDQAYMGGTGMQWTFSNKVSALPQFMAFKASQEERPKKMMFDHHSSSGFQPILTSLDSSQKHCGVITQKAFNLERQGPHFMMPAYQVHPIDGHGVSTHRSHEIRTFPVSNHSFSVAMSSPFFKIHGATAGLNMVANSVKQQPLGGIPVTTPHSVLPVMGSMVGTYAPRKNSKPVAAPPQLTIFYGGAVNVYDDISPEKAQAIISLAGNGSSLAANAMNLKSNQVQALAPKHVALEGILGNQSHSTSPCSGLSSPISVTSHSAGQSCGGSINTDNLMATNGSAPLASSSQSETPKIATSVGSAATTLTPAAVPQARKASLARFLEKRKERVMNTAPYALSKNNTEDALGSDVSGFISKAQTSPVALPSGKDQQWCLGLHKNDAIGAKLQAKSEM
ncbi:protein TIFY 6B isoform X2 [Magnolia sinica]|uniref:protein TIFY 6B isoform X2 n=1 Tax=Magnolia sinica TaxID=86752 RepID=UPI00265AB74D|nr:protein TIFY 6B isoform X2 [Magnolia sinica]